ncbi:DUF6907 domain-containing protein [Streptomyces sp. NPDC127037]|uniref:DUF6907 domain-containing protein n=1 Tax=Streptomyces sp. NPDC127037 TaxID=3347113 RepID=UPI00365B2DD7
MQSTVPATFKTSGAPVTPPAPPVDAWRSMTIGTMATAPIHELLTTLGVRLVEVDPGELAADGIVGYFSGRVGDAEIQIERSLPQADRESVVRDLLARIRPEEQTYTKRSLTGPRLRPAMVGGKPVHIECPSWCYLDHVAENEGFLVDVYHCGDTVSLMAPRMGGAAQPVLHARLNADSFGTDVAHQAPHVIVDDETEFAHMTPEQAREFASNLEAFAAQVRAMAEQAAGR